MALTVQNLRGQVARGPTDRPGEIGRVTPSPAAPPGSAAAPTHPQRRLAGASCRASPRSPIFTCISSVTKKLPVEGDEPERGWRGHLALPPPWLCPTHSV